MEEGGTMTTTTAKVAAPVAKKWEPLNTPEVETVLATLARDGFCLLKGVIPPDEVAAVRESVGNSVRKHSSLPPPQGYVTGFLRVEQSYAKYLAEPRLMAVIDRLFGEFARISVLTGVINGPGIKRGIMHADWPYNQNHNARIRAPYPDVMTNMVTMWMATDYTIDNGGTTVIHGSHKRDHSPFKGGAQDPMKPFPGEVQLVGQAGDVGLFDARTWHAISENRTPQERIGFIVRYAPWWLNLQPLRPGTLDRRQIVDANDGSDARVEPVPREIYERLPADVQALVYHMLDES